MKRKEIRESKKKADRGRNKRNVKEIEKEEDEERNSNRKQK